MSIHSFVNTNGLPPGFSHRQEGVEWGGQGEDNHHNFLVIVQGCFILFYFISEWPNLYYSSVALVIIINQETRISQSNYHSGWIQEGF